MKQFLLLVSAFLTFSGFGQVVPNGGFEIWDLYNTWTLEPFGWETANNQLITPVTQDSLAYEGELAMRVKVLPGFEGGVMSTAMTTLPYTGTPTELNFAVKCIVPDGDDNDHVSVTVELLYQGNTLASSVWESYQDITDWNLINLQIPVIDTEIDELRIIVSAGYDGPLGGGSWDTEISVDAMTFEPINDVGESGVMQDIVLFPNPCADHLYFSRNGGSALSTYLITDAAGKLLLSGSCYGFIDTVGLPAGEYQLQVSGPSGNWQVFHFIKTR